jgi:amino acid adenylation domain-containing protein/thioester reductase-like protein
MTMQDVHTVDPAWNGVTSDYPREQGLAELFLARVEADPDAIAVRHGGERVTYDELDRRACQLAHALRAMGVVAETPVGVYMGQRVEQVVAQVAICKAGGSCVPLDPEYPRERLAFMMEDAGVAVLITDRFAGAGPLVTQRPTLCVDRDRGLIEAWPESLDAGRGPEFVHAAGGAELRSHILYTSGSTGRPKGIEIVGRAINRLVLATDYVQIEPGDRVAQIANFSFDAAIFEVWGALLNGATVVLMSKLSLLDPHVFRAELRERRISVMFMTTALFNHTVQVCPDAFHGLKTLMVGGERANPRTFRAALEAGPPARLLHAYGPTEGTTFTTMRVLGPEDVVGPTVSIGAPIRNTQVHILGPDLRPVAVGEAGELFVGGDGLARGYLNRPGLTAERFLEVAGLLPDPARTVRLYRTGDTAMWRPDGAIEFLGRTDFQVKIRGFRIEIEEVEAALMDSGLLRGAVVAVHEGAQGDKLLIAHVIPGAPGLLAGGALQMALQARLPPYMVPSRFIEIESLPLTANGKLDRAALAIVAERPQPGAAVAPARSQASPLELGIAAIWCELLGVDSLLPGDDFFRLGGNSLLAARLVLRVREVFRVTFPVYVLYESTTLAGFVDAVRRAQEGLPFARWAEEGPAAWQAHARLPDDIRLASEPQSIAGAPVGSPATASKILLTGATGFLGSFLLRELLTQTGARVACLVRARDEAEGRERLRQGLLKYGLWDERYAARIDAVPGDLREVRLGLGPRERAALAESVDTIFHVGAQVSYVQPYSMHRSTNVDGTAEVLRLASRGRTKAVHYVSSVAVFGPSGYFNAQRRIEEDEDLEGHLECLRYDIGYSASKWVAERMVWEAGGRGLPVAVYRPGFIMGHSRTGVGNCEDFMARSIKGCIQLGASPVLPRQRKEFVPVDYVSSAIVNIATRVGADGRAYHLVPPRPSESLDMVGFFELLAECGYPLETMNYSDWVTRLMRQERVGENALCPLIPMLFERVYRDVATRWELYEDMPEFDSSHTTEVLAGTGVPFHRMDRALLGRYLEHWARVGYIPAPAQVVRARRQA